MYPTWNRGSDSNHLQHGNQCILNCKTGRGRSSQPRVYSSVITASRFSIDEICGDSNFSFEYQVDLLRQGGHYEGWLSQATYVFHQLKITSALRTYCTLLVFLYTLPNTTGYISAIRFLIQVNISEIVESLPYSEGYLFIFPPEDLRSGPAEFRWPDLPTYWTLSPTGDEPLSPQDAERLGFPMLNFSTICLCYSLDDKT
jgi:hypothetical protein